MSPLASFVFRNGNPRKTAGDILKSAEQLQQKNVTHHPNNFLKKMGPTPKKNKYRTFSSFLLCFVSRFEPDYKKNSQIPSNKSDPPAGVADELMSRQV